MFELKRNLANMNRYGHSTLHQISGISPLPVTTANEDEDGSSNSSSRANINGAAVGGNPFGDASSFSAISPARAAAVPLPSISGISSIRFEVCKFSGSSTTRTDLF